MDYRVVWTESAWKDLESIANYIARDSKFYAATFVKEIKSASRSLEKFAKRGRIVPEFKSEDIRELFIKSYRLIYKVDHSTVTILAIIHGARNLKK